MPSYRECPYCRRKYIRLRVDGCMFLHRTDVGYVSKGTLFPYCPYGGCTVEEALQGITAIKKRVLAYEKRGGAEGVKKRFRERQERKRREIEGV